METTKTPITKKIVETLRKVHIVRWLGLDRFKMQLVIVGALALFVVTNILLSPVSLRVDLSKGKAYTLSGSTKKIINNLDKTVTITFFVSNDLPTRLQTLRRDVVDLLQEYDRTSGRVEIQILDPKSDADALQKAQEAGIQELQFSQLQQDSYALSTFYFGILVHNEDGQEALPQATDLGSLEYNITSAIYKLTQDALPRVAIIGQQPQILPQIPSPLSTFQSIAERQFALEYISPPEQPPVEEGAPTPTPVPLELTSDYKTALIFDKDGGTYSDEEVQTIKEYIANKGNAIFFVNGVQVDPRQLTATAGESKLVALLKEYGINVQSNLVLSESSELINMGNQSLGLNVFLPYPLWLTTNNYNAEASYFSNINQLSYLWSSSINLGEGNNLRALVNSMPNSWTQSNNFTLNPQQIPEPTQNQLKESIVTAESTSDTRGDIMTIASSQFINDSYQSRSSNNLEFVLNVLNDYASDGALSGIRQRQIDVYPLPEIPENMKQVFKYGNMALLPGIFALFGAYRLMKRNKKAMV